MKAQSTTLDMVVAISIVAIILPVAYVAVQAQQPPNDLSGKAFSVADQIMSPYPPEGFNGSSVVIPGFVVNHEYRPELFENFSALDSIQIQNLLGFETNYFINITNQTVQINQTGTPPSLGADAVSAVTRLAAFEGSIVSIEVVLWQ